MYFVYLIRSKKDRGFYVGITNDLERRLREHNQGIAKSTKARRPFELVYYEAHHNYRDADKRERFLKTGWGRNYLRRVLFFYLQKGR